MHGKNGRFLQNKISFPASVMTDEAIVLECQSGDFAHFDTLYDAYLQRIYDFIYFKTHHRQTAEDLASQVFFSLVENIDSFDSRKGVFAAWIFRIARNKVIDHYRTNKHTSDIADAWDLAADSNVESDVDAKLTLGNLHDAMRQLTAEQREIVLLRIWQDLPFAEIARLLGKKEPAVKMAFGRALQKIETDKLLPLFVLFFFSHQ